MTSSLKTCRQICRQHQFPAFLVSNYFNLTYLSGFFPLSFREREAFLLLTPSEQFLLTDGRYIHQVQALKTGFTCLEVTSSQDFFQTLTRLCQKLKIKKLAFEKNDLRFGEYEKLKKTVSCRLLPAERTVEEKRAVKNSQEISPIKKACQIADQAFSHLLDFLKPGLTEKEVADEIEWFIRKHGATDLSFDPIVAAGKNSAFPHHKTSDQRLTHSTSSGQATIILLDFGAKVDNYCSDMTRVVFLGKATDEQKKVYRIVLEAQKRAIDFLNQDLHSISHPEFISGSPKMLKQVQHDEKLVTHVHNESGTTNYGLKASSVDRIARSYILSHGYPTIPHGLGHGVGLSEHEAPRLSPKSRDILKPGMVFSLEPGIYLPGKFGVRIEDLVFLSKTGVTILTSSGKKIIEL